MKKFLRNCFEAIIGAIKYLYWFCLGFGYRCNIFSIYRVPIIINNFNRLTFPLQLIAFLEKCGLTNIIILDNNSTYPPLLKFYETCAYKVVRERSNHGHLAFWKSGLYNIYKWNYFVYTDSDVVPIAECPANFIVKFKETLDKYKSLDKIGFGIKIDDLSDRFQFKPEVITYEKRYWEKQIAPNLYDAPIDTTFALYKPFSNLIYDQAYTLKCFRFGFPYLIKHLPWYMDTIKMTEEDIYYINTSNLSSSLSQQMRGEQKIY